MLNTSAIQLLHSVSNHVCFHNLQPLCSEQSRSSYFYQASLLALFTNTAHSWGGGVTPMPIVTTATAVKILTVNISVWLLTAQNFGVLTFDPFGISCVLQTSSVTRWHLWQLEGKSFAQCRLHCGNKSVMIALLQVWCTCNLFSSMVKSCLVPRPLTH